MHKSPQIITNRCTRAQWRLTAPIHERRVIKQVHFKLQSKHFKPNGLTLIQSEMRLHTKYKNPIRCRKNTDFRVSAQIL